MYSLIMLPDKKSNFDENEHEKINLDELSDSDDKFEAMKQRIKRQIDEDASNESGQFKFNDMIESDEDDTINDKENNKELLHSVLSNQQQNAKSTDDECEQGDDEDSFLLSDSHLKHRYNSSSDELPLDEIGIYKSPLNHYGLHSVKLYSKIIYFIISGNIFPSCNKISYGC